MEVVRSEIEKFARKKDDDDDRFGARAMLRRKFRVQKQMIDDEHTIEHRFFSSLSFKIFPSFKLLRHLSKSRLAILYNFFFLRSFGRLDCFLGRRRIRERSDAVFE